MKHDRLRDVSYFLPVIESAPAEIDFFLVCEESLIKAEVLFVSVATDKKASARCPENITFIIVLAIVALYGFKDTPTAKRVAVFIDKPTTGACIFKIVFIFEIENFRLDDYS